VIIWLDTGRALGQSPLGPWYDSDYGTASTGFRPVVLQGPNGRENRTPAPRGQTNTQQHKDSQQSAALLQQDYGCTLDREQAAKSPLYLLSELFEFIAASEAQYLDMIRSVLDDHVTAQRIGSSRSDEMRVSLDLLYKGLEKRRDHIGTIIGILETQMLLNGTEPPLRVSLVLSDFRYLMDQTAQLMTRCDHEWNVIMSEAAVAEAQWSRLQNSNQKKFALLASVYAPLSFTTSLFGMQFLNIGSIREGFQIWSLVTFPVFLLSLAGLYWERLTAIGDRFIGIASQS
jgi:Mg2+ and Co2+ transporter CorA